MQQRLNTTYVDEGASPPPSQEASLDQQYKQLFLMKIDKRMENFREPWISGLWFSGWVIVLRWHWLNLWVTFRGLGMKMVQPCWLLRHILLVWEWRALFCSGSPFFHGWLQVSIGWRGPTLGLFCIGSLKVMVSQHSCLTSTTRQGYSVALGAVLSVCWWFHLHISTSAKAGDAIQVLSQCLEAVWQESEEPAVIQSESYKPSG